MGLMFGFIGTGEGVILFDNPMQIIVQFGHGGKDVVGCDAGKVLWLTDEDGAHTGSLCGNNVRFAVSYHP